jgi:hypothetical protein
MTFAGPMARIVKESAEIASKSSDGPKHHATAQVGMKSAENQLQGLSDERTDAPFWSPGGLSC